MFQNTAGLSTEDLIDFLDTTVEIDVAQLCNALVTACAAIRRLEHQNIGLQQQVVDLRRVVNKLELERRM